MMRALCLCLALGAALPAMAGEKEAAKLRADARALLARDAKATASTAKPSPVTASLSGVAASPQAAVRTSAATPKVDHVMLSNIALSSSTKFKLTTLQAMPDWRIDTRLPETTSSAGGAYMVRDTLANYRKPRFRKSVLSAMFMLKLDGNEDSAPFSLGGGAVASALWRAMPRR